VSEPTQPMTGGTQPLNPVNQPEEHEPFAIGTVLKDIYRVTALLTDTPTLRVYRVALLEPWDHCARCGAALQASDQFCEECGAQVEEQTALLQETPAAQPIGAALLDDLPDDPARAALPTVREVFVGEDSRFAVLPDGTSLVRFDTLLSEPNTFVDQTDAVDIGIQVARALAYLHRHGLALGQLTLADLALTNKREIKLADAGAIRRSLGKEDQLDDVEHLGLVLEKMAGIQRQTRRLDDSNNPSPLDSAFATILSDLRAKRITDASILAQTLETLLAEQATPISLRVRTGYATDVGMIRDHNEDSVLTWDLRLNWDAKPVNVGLYVVADGMGGHEGGEVASGLAITTTAQTLVPTLLDPQLHAGPVSSKHLAELVKQAAFQANQAVYEESVRRKNDMGTTLTMAVVIGDRAIVGNVGDSRTYLYRDGKLQRISKDHSLVQRLIDIGQLDPDDIYTHPQRNAILKSLGDSGDPGTDTFEVQLQPNDALFLCSDGMWEMVRDPKMAALFAEHANPADLCDALIEAGNAGGGEDNISVVVVRFDALPIVQH